MACVYLSFYQAPSPPYRNTIPQYCSIFSVTSLVVHIFQDVDGFLRHCSLPSFYSRSLHTQNSRVELIDGLRRLKRNWSSLIAIGLVCYHCAYKGALTNCLAEVQKGKAHPFQSTSAWIKQARLCKDLISFFDTPADARRQLEIDSDLEQVKNVYMSDGDVSKIETKSTCNDYCQIYSISDICCSYQSVHAIDSL